MEQPSDICRSCGRRGQPVPRETLESLLTPNALERLRPGPYFFVGYPACDIIYFSNEQNSYFARKDVRVIVGVKEDDRPTPICYCFGHTVESARDEILSTGKSTLAQDITREIRGGNCACEMKKPSGRCCLGEVNKAVQAIFTEAGIVSTGKR